ncbi:4Fe-4S dicluster domain-containing protein [Bacteroidota bacterium]
MESNKIKIDFEKRKKLEKILGAEQLSYCYQCGACVGDCPTARFDEKFNPREIMLKSLIGAIDEYIKEDSIIWLCSNCYNCYERCPQDVRPVEVIIALKNTAVQGGHSPKGYEEIIDRIKKTGFSVPIMSSSNRMREELGLKPIVKREQKDLKILLKPDAEEDK